MDGLYRSSRKIPITSINYGFMPTSMDRQKVIYVVTQFPPAGLRIGSFVNIEGADVEYVKFQVTDIEGQRIVLASNVSPSQFVSYKGSPRYYGPEVLTWDPLSYGGNWGYTTRRNDAFPMEGRNWHYGRGLARAYLVY
jgi:hypothetical protein